MSVPSGPLMDALRRTTHSGFGDVVLHQRQILQCYDISQDSDVGLHYILFIPEEEPYADPFYELSLLIKPKDLLAQFKEHHQPFARKRIDSKIKPKDAREVFDYAVEDGVCRITFNFILQDEVFDSFVYEIPVATEEHPIAANIIDNYDKLLERIKIGGICNVYDGNQLGLVPRIIDCPEIYWYHTKIGDVRLRVPFIKSMFSGIKVFDDFHFTIQESTLDHIYVFAYAYTKRKLQECYYGYVLEY